MKYGSYETRVTPQGGQGIEITWYHCGTKRVNKFVWYFMYTGLTLI